MNFSWIKRLFKIKSSTNGSDVGISTIDTSFIKVPKLSDLSKDNQDKVMEYFNEIKYDNYSTIVKYSDSLLEKSNKEIDLFVHDLEDSIKNISAILKKVNKYNYLKLLLYREEIKLCIEELNKIEEEAELRLIALDTYIKKEQRRKYDFLGIFGKAERLRYLSDKSSLLNERQRLLIAIKLNKQHLQIIYNTLNENKDLLEATNNYYINSSKSFDTKYCDARISMVYASKLLELKRLIDKNDCSELEKIAKNSEKYLETILKQRFVGISSIQEFDRIHESLKYQEVIPFLARENRMIKHYAYEHRNDYKEFINEINTIVSKYEKMSSTDWDIKELEKNFEKYKVLIDGYREVCKKYITDDILLSMVKSLLNLNYFVYCLVNKFIAKWTYSDKKISKNELLYDGYWDLDIENMIVKDAEIKYYYQKALELFKQIEDKYNVKLDYSLVNQFSKDKERLENIDYIRMKGELKYLYDILNGNFEIFDLFFKFNLDIESSIIVLKNNIYDIQDNSYVSIDNLFYLLKFLNINKYSLSELLMAPESFHPKYNIKNEKSVTKSTINCYKLKELLVKSYISKLEKNYDDRILIIPKEIKFHPLIEYGHSKVLYSVDDELNISDRAIGIYLSDSSQAITINRALGLKQSQIKYLFMNEKIYNEFKKTYNTINTKVIVVPDYVKYSELSSYLDRELEKENNEEKVLSKKI